MRGVLFFISFGVVCFASGWLSKPPTIRKSVEIPTARTIVLCPKSPLTKTAAAAPNPTTSGAEAARIQRKAHVNELIREATDLSTNASSKDADRAIELFTEALALEPNNLNGLRTFSNFLISKHDTDSARPLLERCLALRPDDELCAGNLTTYFLMTEDREGLDSATRECLKSAPDNMMCLNNRGNCFLQIHDYADALDVFLKMERLDRAAKIHFNRSYVFHELGTSYEGLGQVAMARQSYDDACRAGDNFACTLAQEL